MRRIKSAWRTRAIATNDTLYLCKAYSGGTFWSNDQCTKQQALIERIVAVPDGLPLAPRRFVWNETESYRSRRYERAGRKMTEPGHAQVGDGDEVGGGAVAARSALGLLQ